MSLASRSLSSSAGEPVVRGSRDAQNGVPHQSPDVVTGNVFDKYRSSSALHQALMTRFLRAAASMVQTANPRSVLEIGCGPGDLAQRLFPRQEAVTYTGIDIGADEIRSARVRCPAFDFRVGSAYDLPCPDRSADLVVACEVFEHLDNPERALAEAQRVCSGFLLLSVPWEPTWRILNLLRGKYVRRLGNTPGHVQHFSRGAIQRLVSRRFEILQLARPFPWTMLLARPRHTASGAIQITPSH